MKGAVRITAPAVALTLLLALMAVTASEAPVSAAGRPRVELSRAQAGTGGSITVSGTGWRPRTLLMLLICGRSVPSGGVTGGTGSCANADGRAVTTGVDGRFRRRLPVVEPPVPCPCVVHVETVTGARAEVDTAFQVAGHAVEPPPAESAGGRLSLTEDARLEGSSGLLTRFGSPPARTLVLTVTNVGTSPVRDPVFQVGTSHGVYAPRWQAQPWRGTVPPGREARIELPVELPAGAHGDYLVSLKYGGRILAEHPWPEPRPWGVTLFWVLTCLTVPAAAIRAATALMDRAKNRGMKNGPSHRVVRRPVDRPADLT